MVLQEVLREYCPNIRPLRCFVSHMKIRSLNTKLLAEEDVRRGELDIQVRNRLVAQCSSRWPGYAAKANAKIETLFEKAPSYRKRTDKEQLRTNMLFYRFAYGFLPEEYLCFGLEERSIDDCRSFVSDIERIRYDAQMSDMADSKVYKDKAKTYEEFKPYYQRDIVGISRKQDKYAFLEFVEKHPIFVKKEVYESCGRGTELIDIRKIETNPEMYFYQLINRGKHVLEETIQQSRTMSALNDSSVNTVRCMTFNTLEGIVIPWCFVKMGRKGAFVDNAGAGGVIAGIDCNTGSVATDAFNEYGERFVMHPDTGLPVKGFKMPDWALMKQKCCEMAAKTPTVGFIGWDLAHTNNGWVVVEGNNCGQLIGPQIVWQHGIKAEVIGIMKRMRLMA